MKAYPHSTIEENALRALFGSIFSDILTRDSQDEKIWKRRLWTLKVNGLLSFSVLSPVQPQPYVVEIDKLDDYRYRRQVIRQLSLPRPRKYTQVHMRIDRNELSKPEYLSETASLLAFNWVRKLLPVPSAHEMLLLLQSDLATLTRALNTMYMHQSTGENVARLVLRQRVDETIAASPKIQKIFADLEQRFDAIRAKADEDLRKYLDESIARDRERFEQASREFNAMVDEKIKKYRDQ